ncbi:MAG: hypothetical protein ABII82_05075 [Verrucomicrobiota bacterium]
MITRLFLLLCLACLAPTAALAAKFEAILVVASKDAGKTDPRLAPYAPNLKRLLRFESFQQAGKGRADIGIPGSGTINIGAGQTLNLTTSGDPKSGPRVQIKWQQGDRLLMNTGLVLRPGVPAVLGGPATPNGGVYAVILTAN